MKQIHVVVLRPHGVPAAKTTLVAQTARVVGARIDPRQYNAFQTSADRRLMNFSGVYSDSPQFPEEPGLAPGERHSWSGLGRTTAKRSARMQLEVVQSNVSPLASAQFTFGNAGRDIITGPGTHQLDASMFKNISFNERVHAQFRAEVFCRGS